MGRRTRLALAAGAALAVALGTAATDARAGMDGKILIERKGCLACHSLMGNGAHMGPPLQNTPAWSPPERMRKYILDPKSVNPKSIMPAAHLSDADVDAIVTYLQGFKGEAKAPEGWKPK
jgi:mono/diheme cytochrome c family protein